MEQYKTFAIATGKNRKSKNWIKEICTWDEFLERCSSTQRTAETVAQYQNMSHDKRGDVKDVGGYVAGSLNGTRRIKSAIVSRSMITLDLDHVNTTSAKLWAAIDANLDFALLVYSSHSHTTENPRLRLVIPTSREMAPDEYEPVARKIAEIVGIEFFDVTTYDPARLMYWPSTPSDGDFFTRHKEGEFCDPDKILERYSDWRDVSTWPRSVTEDKVVKREVKKLGDPREKTEGESRIIGAFCRAYSIEEAINTFLSDVYEEGTQGRYTFKNGSTANGVVCYNGLYAYSHHESDPAGRKECNAFDLVRIHKFGYLDNGNSSADVTRLKSYKAMRDFATNDDRVKVALLHGAGEDFAGIDLSDAEQNWKTGLEFASGKKNELKPTIQNFTLILENDAKLRGRFWINELSLYIEAENLPWRRELHQWTDFDDSQLRGYLETKYNLYSKERLNDAFNAVAMNNRKHPVKAYLLGLHWDGTPRLDSFIIRYLGAQDAPLNKAMTRKHFVAAVARIMEPGVKYDQCLTLTGPEETGKSSLFRIMGTPWFDDSITTIEGKEGRECLRGKWIIELAELSGIKRSEVAAVKNFLSNQVDSYRAAYDRRVTPYPRQCVFCATTNEDKFLKGDTGNRRFWVIEILPGLAMPGPLSERLEQLEQERPQLWAEAVHYYNQGERLYLNDELSARLRATQEEFSDESDDPYKPLLEEFLYMKLPTDWATRSLYDRRDYLNNRDPLEQEPVCDRERFCIAEFLCEKIGLRTSDKNYKYEARKIGRLMKAFPDWTPGGTTKHAKQLYGVQKLYRRIYPPDDEEDL